MNQPIIAQPGQKIVYNFPSGIYAPAPEHAHSKIENAKANDMIQLLRNNLGANAIEIPANDVGGGETLRKYYAEHPETFVQKLLSPDNRSALAVLYTGIFAYYGYRKNKSFLSAAKWGSTTIIPYFIMAASWGESGSKPLIIPPILVAIDYFSNKTKTK